MGRTSTLLQLYLQPALQGYPPFIDLPKLYNASITLSNLIATDVQVFNELNSIENFLPVLEKFIATVDKNLPNYISVLGMFFSEFGNVQADPNDNFVQEMSILAG